MTDRRPLVNVSGTVQELPAGDAALADAIQLRTDATHTVGTGELAWNADEETADLGLTGDVVLQLGQETHYHVLNASNTTAIPNGTLVMAAGTNGASGKIKVKPWDASGPSKYIIGIATATIAAEYEGYVTAFGKVRGIQTNGANYSETWVDGDILYAGAAGGLTKTLPVAPNTKTTIAIVIAAHASNGTLFVRPTYGSQLGEDELVQLASLADGDVLVYDGTDGRFENKTLADANILAANAVKIPFYQANGTLDTISLTTDQAIPFYRANGTLDPIPLVT